MLEIISKIHLKLQPCIPSLKLEKTTQKLYIDILDQKIPGLNSLEYTEKKYKSYSFISKWYKLLYYDLISAFCIGPSLIYLISKSFFRKNGHIKNSIYFSKLLPIDLIDSNAYFAQREFSISPKELVFIIRSFKIKVLRPYFFLRIIWKSGLYFTALKRYSPKKIYCSEEMNFESPFLSLICSQYKTRHINVMHGNKLFYIKDAFVLFDEFYVWLPEFQKLFKEMKAQVQEYKFFNPIPPHFQKKVESKPIFKYYAQISDSQNEFEKRLTNSLKFAKDQKLSFIFRPHPRHFGPAELEILNKHKVQVEPFSTPILESIMESEIVCAEWSSVLFQAKSMSKKIIIDNTNKKNIIRLKELGDIILKDPSVIYLLP